MQAGRGHKELAWTRFLRELVSSCIPLDKDEEVPYRLECDLMNDQVAGTMRGARTKCGLLPFS